MALTHQDYTMRPTSPEIPQQTNHPWADGAGVASPTSTMNYGHSAGVEYTDIEYKKTALELRREKVAAYKTKKRMTQAFGGDCTAPVGQQKPAAAAAAAQQQAAPWQYAADDGADDDSSYSSYDSSDSTKKSAKELRLQMIATYKTKKRMSQNFGACHEAPVPQQKPKEPAPRTAPFQYGTTESATMDEGYHASDAVKKTSLELRREKIAEHKTKKRMSQNFGACHEPVAVQQKPKPAAQQAAPWQYQANGSADDDDASYASADSAKKESKELRRQKIAEHKTKKRMNQTFGACHEAPVKPKPAQPTIKATTTRTITKRPEDVRDPETVAGMKDSLDIDRERWAAEKALKMINYVTDMEGEGFQIDGFKFL